MNNAMYITTRTPIFPRGYEPASTVTVATAHQSLAEARKTGRTILKLWTRGSASSGQELSTFLDVNTLYVLTGGQ